MRLRGGKCGMAINDRGGWAFDGEVPEARVRSSSFLPLLEAFIQQEGVARESPLPAADLNWSCLLLETQHNSCSGDATDSDAARLVFRFSQAASVGEGLGTGHSPTLSLSVTAQGPCPAILLFCTSCQSPSFPAPVPLTHFSSHIFSHLQSSDR